MAIAYDIKRLMTNNEISASAVAAGEPDDGRADDRAERRNWSSSAFCGIEDIDYHRPRAKAKNRLIAEIPMEKARPIQIIASEPQRRV